MDEDGWTVVKKKERKPHDPFTKRQIHQQIMIDI